MNTGSDMSQIKIGDVILSQDGLRTYLLEKMTDYIEKKTSLNELLQLSEAIRRNYLALAPKDVKEVLNKLHEIYQDIQNPEKKSLTDEEIIFKIDEFILSLLKSYPKTNAVKK